ncbi:DUF397 domain-containing protein [Streptomyces scabiei]|uniref:DUF397 domain-containing protein n=1 Tax=Streptomyces scabiei TaxID=1930 RepID=UPI002990355B|nr:DUF397 domain-containing protein [Streptomyces scabiei]MDW8805431.1 DUF397 domain-containing protein [Streptomyces scabiei]
MKDLPASAKLATAAWFKSSYSAADNECVEIALASPWVGIRDSKALHRGALAINTNAFTRFVNATKTGNSMRIL